MALKLFERAFNRNLRKEKIRLVREARRMNEDALSDALGGSDVGDNAALSATLGDIQQAARQNRDTAAQLQKMIDRNNMQMNDVILGWIERLEDFVQFVNDPLSDSSIKSFLDSSEPGSIFNEIKETQSRSLTRVAQSVTALAQALRSYVVGGISGQGQEEEPETERQAQPAEEEDYDTEQDEFEQ